MPKPKMVEIKKGDLIAEVVSTSVAAWKRNGWTVVDDESSEVEVSQPAAIEVNLPPKKTVQVKPDTATNKTEE